MTRPKTSTRGEALPQAHSARRPCVSRGLQASPALRGPGQGLAQGTPISVALAASAALTQYPPSPSHLGVLQKPARAWGWVGGAVNPGNAVREQEARQLESPLLPHRDPHRPRR